MISLSSVDPRRRNYVAILDVTRSRAEAMEDMAGLVPLDRNNRIGMFN